LGGGPARSADLTNVMNRMSWLPKLAMPRGRRTDGIQSTLVSRQPRNFHHRANFNGSLGGRRNALGDGDCFVKVPSVDDVEAAQLFACLGERTVGDERLAVADADAGRRRDRMQWRGGYKLSLRVQLVRQPRGLLVAMLPLS